MLKLLVPLTTRILATVALFVGVLPACTIAQQSIREGEYKSPNQKFSVTIPKPSHWAGAPWMVTSLDNLGDPQYERVMFHVGDFGEYIVVGARTVPGSSVVAMDKDDHRTVLRNISQASLMGWRRDLSTLPEIVEESFTDSTYGEAIVRIYRVPKGSFLVRAQGRGPTSEDRFDTSIASIVARRGATVLFVLTQNDSSPGKVKGMAEQVFPSIKMVSAQQ